MQTTDELYNSIAAEINEPNEFIRLRSITWVVLGMLDHESAEGIKNPVTAELSDRLLSSLQTSTDETAILGALYDVFYWGEANTIMQAVRCLKSDYSALYDEKLIKACAKELLYGKPGVYLLNPQAA